MIRRCCDCGAEIRECMGFVVAGDALLALDGIIPWREVGERCGTCVERWLIKEGRTPRWLFKEKFWKKFRMLFGLATA